MSTIRSLIQDGDLPKLIESDEEGKHKYTEFQDAVMYGENNLFRQVGDLLSREPPETDIAKGIHMMYGLVGETYSGASETVYAVALQHDAAMLDMTKITSRALQSLKIQQLVDYIMATPSRCVILVKIISDKDRMHKVMKRIAAKETSTRHRRIVFCMASDEANLYTVYPSMRRLHFPGTVDDRIAMLLYRVPSTFADPERLRVVAEKLRDYAVFEPKIKRLLNTEGTPDEYVSSLHYQVVRRNGTAKDEVLDDFPSFEVSWRRCLSENLQNSLVPSPDMTSSAIHRVLPVGVSGVEALRCFQSALPADLKTPYVMTVESQASSDKCGSIAIVQETQHTVIHINLSVDPAVMSEVCRELRLGYRSVVTELSEAKAEITAKLEHMDKKFASLHDDIGALKELVKAGSGDKKKRAHVEEMGLEEPICKKRSCRNPVTQRFVSGAFKKQCASCNSF
jgi:hypothetical protein